MIRLKQAKERTAEDNRALRDSVTAIIDNVCENGDRALHEYNEKFDDCKRVALRVTEEEIQEAYQKMTEQELQDLKDALANIRAFAEAQKGTISELTDFSPRPGIFLGHKVIPVSACCCYVPGGGYPLYSTALMLITPAKVAGVKRVTACSPTVRGTSKIHYKTLVAMDMAGADEIYAVGGAQSIAAFSYGTEEIQPVDLIVGPGNRYVTEAKRQCYGQIGIDFVAGPSEVLVIADDKADSQTIAADLLAQAEHDPNAKGILVTTSQPFAESVMNDVEAALLELSTADIARKSWEDYGEVILVDSLTEAVEISNAYAPEHLEINIENPQLIVDELINYGSLFIGGNTAEVFGDYASGTNHTLPTVRASRYTGGVWVGTFLKTCTYQYMTNEASKAIAPLVERMAYGEGLEGHAKAAAKRK